jgi:hypothetical protein
VVKSHFTIKLKGAPGTLETTKAFKLIGAGSSGGGDYTGVKTVGNVLIALSGCSHSGVKCHSAGAGEGEIRTGPLGGALGVLKLGASAAKNTIGLDLYAAEGSATIAQFSCGSTSGAVRGSVIVPVRANKMLSTGTLTYKQAKGRQNPEAFLEAPRDVLETSLEKGSFEQTGLKMTLTQTGEEPVEVSSVI